MTNYITRGGGNLVNERLLFSDDARYLFCASGNDIHVYSISSEECCLILKGHEDRVTSIVINPMNQLQIISSSINGEIIKWDFSDNVLLRKYESCLQAIYCLYAPVKMSNKLYVVADILNQGTSFIKLTLDISINNNSLKTKSLISGVNCSSNCNDLGAMSSIFGFAFERNLHIYHLKNKSFIRHRVPKNSKITCMRCHPTESCIATGLDNGKIYIWRDLFTDKGKYPVTSIVHWHALPLRCLAFTPEGSYLLSGGYECVLVKWHLESFEKDTLPRLGSPIINICSSLDANLYALSHIDNGIQIITNTLKIIQTFQGLVKCHKDLQVKNICPINLIYDQKMQALVLNGGPGELQFYDWKKNVQLFRLDVVGENYVSPENLCNPLELTEVLLANFDHEGDWLATVEGRSYDYMSILKFWQYENDNKSFNLNTCINMPHEKAITNLMFKQMYHSKTHIADLCFTTSNDGTFKIWTLTNTSDIYKSSVGWRLRSTGSFKNFIPLSMDFSFDGTIFSVGFSSVLTIWDSSNCKLIHSDDVQIGDIRKTVFEKYVNSYKMLYNSSNYLSSYDVLKYCVLWVIPLKVNSVVTHPFSQEFAVFFYNDNSSIDLQFYNALEPKYTKSYKNISKSPILSSLYAQDDLLFFTENQDLLEFKPIDESMEDIKDLNKMGKLLLENKSQVGEMWNNILGNKRITDGKIDQGKDVEIIEMEKYNKIIEMPIYIIPPFENLCMPFLESYIKRKDRKKISQSSNDMINEEVDSDDLSDYAMKDDENRDSDDDSDLDVVKKSNSNNNTNDFIKSSDLPDVDKNNDVCNKKFIFNEIYKDCDFKSDKQINNVSLSKSDILLNNSYNDVYINPFKRDMENSSTDESDNKVTFDHENHVSDIEIS